METKTKSSSNGNSPVKGIGSLLRLLPTGTVFTYTFLNPLLANNGRCKAHPTNKILSAILIALCGISCAFSSFTDSYTDSEGKTHYGIVTLWGLWPSPKGNDAFFIDNSKYRLRFGDFVHGFFAMVVFGVVVVLDKISVQCFFPALEASQGVMLTVLPTVIGVLASFIFAVFPADRHWFGYPSNQKVYQQVQDSK